MQINSEYEADYNLTEIEHGPFRNAIQFSCPRSAEFVAKPMPEFRPNCLLLEVTPVEGEVWLGSFQEGRQGITGLFTTPSSETFCLVLKGQGYWVPVRTPSSYECIPVFPVQNVIVIPSHNRLVFFDFTDLIAYGSKGLAWKVERLSWDGLSGIEVIGDRIHGKAWDAPTDQEVDFRIKVDNGTREGGANMY